MIYQSTRGSKNCVTSTNAVLNGIAEDGGLYMPKDLDYSKFNWKELIGLTTLEMASKILGFFLDDFENPFDIISRAYMDKFDTEELTPVKKVGDRYVLELFHGPTSAFKDVALSVLPQLMMDGKKAINENRKIVILTATSGDTGKAALEGFHDIEGIEIFVFYPDGGVSPVQRLQMATQAGENVHVCAVKGNFDDCQTGVKNIFNYVKENGIPVDKNVILSSANSINIGRLVPQIVYYFKAYSDLIKYNAISLNDPIDFTVPTGNFGDILAGYLAKKMGLPIGKLICASNSNNVLTDFIRTGVYNKNRDFYKTISPSMDILVSSNLERLLFMVSDNNSDVTKDLMNKLSKEGSYKISEDMLAKIQDDFDADFASDAQVLGTIKSVFDDYSYLMDTHTASAWCVSNRFNYGRPNVVLSTASPYKFPGAVASALQLKSSDDEFELMRTISSKTNTEIPRNLSSLNSKDVRFTDVIDKDKMMEYIMNNI